MATITTNSENYTNIANAIRSLNGQTTQYKPEEMAAAILELDQDTTIIFAKDYISNDVLNISDIPITSNCLVWFTPGTYNVNGCTISNLENVNFDLRGAVLNLNDYFVDFSGCENIRIIGGSINNASEHAVKAQNTTHFTMRFTKISNTGSSIVENTAAIQIFGDCDNFEINQCCIDGVTSGVVSSDGFIHAYGIFVNRLSSSNAYSRNGIIKQCTVNNVAGVDTDSVKADGDGIFLQAPPYIDDNDAVIWRNDIRISIDSCVITNCKKRAVKSACVGVSVKNTVIDGAFWYAGIDAQYGFINVENCYINNTSDYTGSITSAIVSSEGGLNVRGCTIKAPYGESSYHPGIRFSKRLPASVISSTTPWDNIFIDNCFFDKVSRAVYGYVSDTTSPVPLKGIYIRDCRFGDFNQGRAVEISDTMFSSIESFVFTDFRFDYGSNRYDVKNVNSSFVYPISMGLTPTITYELYSKHWTNEPCSGYDGLPTCPHTRIVYSGDGMGNITHKEYTGHGSLIYGNRSPASITSTLSKQLLYNSMVGDRYTDTSSGTIYICTTAGTSSDIGTWTEIPDKTYIDNQILGGAS